MTAAYLFQNSTIGKTCAYFQGGDLVQNRPTNQQLRRAAGIGLGRLGVLEQLDDAKIREEIDTALNTTIQFGFATNHSLCHGALGNIELLLMAARLLNRAEDYEALERATALIVGSIEANGWISGAPLGVETPGLMTGLAGIGYELLRLAEPDQVPCVLLLAPPYSHSSG